MSGNPQAPLSRSNPSLSAWSSRAAVSDMLALPARRQQTVSYRSSEKLWQSTLVHVMRITLEMVSAKVRESKYLASDSSHCSTREIVRRCSRALALLRWILSVTAIVRAFHVVTTCANPRLASLVRRPCRSDVEPPSPRSLLSCLTPCAVRQPALLVL